MICPRISEPVFVEKKFQLYLIIKYIAISITIDAGFRLQIKRHIAGYGKTFKVAPLCSDTLPARLHNFIHFPVSPILV
jgi:hypothetical protein